MASVSRTATRALRSTPAASTFRTTATRRVPSTARQTFQRQSHRGYATSPLKNTNSYLLYGSVAAAFLVAGGLATYTKRPAQAEAPTQQDAHDATEEAQISASHSQADYQAVYDAIAEKLIEESDYDDGSYGPVLLRLGWHASGTYDAETGTGGSNGATMRFAPEKDHGANSGLAAARKFLEPVKEQFPWISYSDLWILAAVCAIQEMGGPTIPWRPGRSDRDAAWCTPDGRLPDGSKSHDHLRGIFGRMGFNDQEIVALSGAHAVGRCHTDRSGFEGPWTFSPITLTNDYYRLLLDERWNERNWIGPRQFQDDSTKTLMMLPTDMSLVEDASFRAHVERYAKDQEEFFEDFGKVIMKLFELGVPFPKESGERMEFRRTE